MALPNIPNRSLPLKARALRWLSQREHSRRELRAKLLRAGGMLMTFSCSGGVSADLFQKIIAGAALDAGVDAQIIEHLGAGPDHPVALSFPEGEYLKGLLCRVPG